MGEACKGCVFGGRAVFLAWQFVGCANQSTELISQGSPQDGSQHGAATSVLSLRVDSVIDTRSGIHIPGCWRIVAGCCALPPLEGNDIVGRVSRTAPPKTSLYLRSPMHLVGTLVHCGSDKDKASKQ